MSPLVDIRESPLDVLEVERSVSRPTAGAVVSFVGRVRDHNDGKVVVRLEYEAYPSMAIKEMAQIVADIEARIPGTCLGVVHRTGCLDVGDAAIVCAASAAHRAEAFEACRLLIDEVKSRVPIWKREHGPDGPYWVGWEDARCSTGHEHDGVPTSRKADAIASHHHCRHSSPSGSVDRPILDGMNVTCVTVSDTRTLASDQSGDLAEELLKLAGATVQRCLVRDEPVQIAQALTSAVASSPDAVFFTGGTGIGPRDVTYDAILPLLERRIEGFGEAFRRFSVDEIGPRGLLSRAIAGTIGHVIVFAVPGSPKAVRLAIEALIVPLLPHARAMVNGGGH